MAKAKLTATQKILMGKGMYVGVAKRYCVGGKKK